MKKSSFYDMMKEVSRIVGRKRPENPTLLKEMRHYRERDEMPDDFDTFWDKHVAGAEGS
ncbi:hypothetical protein STRDD11_02600 [Streptococcus sp. DD11]|nr:hypothetical protein STRDD11_02600 [Streptococcus sp. DD11]